MGGKRKAPTRTKPKKVNPYAKPKQKKAAWPVVALALACCIALGVGAWLIWGRAGKDDGGKAASPAHIAIDVAGYGVITAELYPDIAPVTVANFTKLVSEGFYDGLTFHRVISGFMIQGGDPKGDGTGGSAQMIKGEFIKNGVVNNLKHTRGVLSMARSTDMNSASSQFFIMHDAAPHLDGGYAAFGMVLTGMEVVDAICHDTPVVDENGTVLRENQPVITSIRLIEPPQG